MQQLSRCFVVAIVLVGALVAGCNTGPDHLGHNDPASQDFDPLVFPWEGQLGDPAQAGGDDFGSTAAILIDSNYIQIGDIRAATGAPLEYFNLHEGRVTIKIKDANDDNLNWDGSIEANLRSVVNLAADRTSVISLAWPGAWFTAAIFDLPSELSVINANSWIPAGQDAYPAMALVEVYIDGNSTPLHTSRFRITGGLGIPNDLADPSIWGQATLQEDLESQRMIRLRGKRGAQGQMFYEGQPPIGALEFDLEYLTVCARNMRAYPSTDAANATAIIGPPTEYFSRETVHVVMVDPKGIEIPFLQDLPPYITTDPTLAGQGPFIDLAFDEDPMWDCDSMIPDPSYWTISNLLVTDLSGDVILERSGEVPVDTTDAPDSNAVLRLYAMVVESP